MTRYSWIFCLTVSVSIMPHFVWANIFHQAPRFYSPESTEAIMTYDHWLEVEAEQLPSEEEALEMIDEQVLFLLGNMRAFKSSPRGDEEITEVKIVETKAQPKTFRIDYHYKGHVLLGLDSTILKSGVILPINPRKIYYDAIVKNEKGEDIYPCTDRRYNDAESFWYFWGPHRPGCHLQEGVHFLRFYPEFERQKNTMTTYPEYSRLVDASGEISAWLFVGMDDGELSSDPFTTPDANAQEFLKIRQMLKEAGFQGRSWTLAELKWATRFMPKEKLPTVEEYTFEGKTARMKVNIFYGRTGLFEESRAFHRLYKRAAEKASVVIYMGHSGLGEYLDLPEIEQQEHFKIRMPKNQYQIFMLFGCSTYSYYTEMYRERKMTRRDPQGTQNLDILATGQAIGTNTYPEATMALFSIVQAWARDGHRTSYQEFLGSIDHGRMLSVTGDEENP